jgi:hypothetical protein
MLDTSVQRMRRGLLGFSCALSGAKSEQASEASQKSCRCRAFGRLVGTRASNSRIVVAQSIGQHHMTWIRRTQVMMQKGKLSPEGEVIAAYGAAMVAARSNCFSTVLRKMTQCCRVSFLTPLVSTWKW